jgi:peptidoglycan hydrolase-like protein with peptidoglycan-binding domain
MSRAEIMARIAEIQTIIARLQEIMVQLGTASCSSLTQNLYFGMSGDAQVMCLQEFLKNQGATVYPEGIVNGNFYNATLQAVIRFQGKYGFEATGFVGPLTRAKINSLLSQ